MTYGCYDTVCWPWGGWIQSRIYWTSVGIYTSTVTTMLPIDPGYNIIVHVNMHKKKKEKPFNHIVKLITNH